MSQPYVAILTGSDSYLPTMEAAFEILKKFNIPFETKISSAHCTPEAMHIYGKDAGQRGCAAVIAATGMAAHLASAVAANTLKPVIGVSNPVVAEALRAECKANADAVIAKDKALQEKLRKV
jgi:5-(carboxyamino)imidazole ribonucleotide mutase